MSVINGEEALTSGRDAFLPQLTWELGACVGRKPDSPTRKNYGSYGNSKNLAVRERV